MLEVILYWRRSVLSLVVLVISFFSFCFVFVFSNMSSPNQTYLPLLILAFLVRGLNPLEPSQRQGNGNGKVKAFASRSNTGNVGGLFPALNVLTVASISIFRTTQYNHTKTTYARFSDFRCRKRRKMPKRNWCYTPFISPPYSFPGSVAGMNRVLLNSNLGLQGEGRSGKDINLTQLVASKTIGSRLWSTVWVCLYEQGDRQCQYHQ